MTAIFRLWERRLTGDTPLTHSLCRQGAKTIWPLAVGGEARGHRTSMTRDEATRLLNIMLRRVLDHDAPQVAEADAVKGARWLMGRTARELDGLNVEVDLTKPTRWIAGLDIGHRDHIYVPVYEASTLDGGLVQYAPVSWQTRNWNTLRDDVRYVSLHPARSAA